MHGDLGRTAPAAPASAAGIAPMGDDAFGFIRRFVHRHCGIALSEQKRQLVQGRLARRLRELGLTDYEAYCQRLRQSPEAELGALASAISTNVTAFFRESHHFQYLAATLLPAWLQASARPRIRLWSAGCASGEEPYTLAMVLAEAMERYNRHADALILATDLSPQALATARAGVYRLDRIDGIDEARRRRWLRRGAGVHAGMASVHPHLRERVRIQPLNLLHEWPMKGRFDAIFCRNVVIYFDPPTKQRLFSRFAASLQAGGYLFLGHSESMLGLSEDFDLVGRTVYRKRTS